jgi:hypothetical protein
MYNTIASIAVAGPLGRPSALLCRACARAAPMSSSDTMMAARNSITTCFVGDRFTSKPPMCIGCHRGPHSCSPRWRPMQISL